MRFTSILATATMLASSRRSAAEAQRLAKPSSGQKLQEATANDVPRCARKLGTLSIADGDDPSGWTQFSLAPPRSCSRCWSQRSGCFNLVDRGTGLNAAQRERDIGGNLGLQRGANVGQGQIKAADYVLVAEVQGANSNVSGGGAGGRRSAACVGGRVGGLLGGIKSQEAGGQHRPLADQRPHHRDDRDRGRLCRQEQHRLRRRRLPRRSGRGRRRLRQYRDRPHRDAQLHPGLFEDGHEPRPASSPAPPAPPRPRRRRPSPRKARSRCARRRAAGGALVRTLPAGAIVYPTGPKNGLWWEVADENDNVGWVLNTKLAPSQ